MAQLETLEAKMASIEVSLSTTPRRRKGGGSLGGSLGGSVPRLSARPDVGAREIEGLRTALQDRESVIQSLRQQLGLGRLPRSPGVAPMTDSERPLAEQRLGRLKTDSENKRISIRNIKAALERLDITDNIDVRIRQAELEYALGREELELLSLVEEAKTLQCRLERAQAQKQEQNSIFSLLRSGMQVSLQAFQISSDPERPRWSAGPRPNAPGLYVEWVMEGESLHRGDRILEVNGKLVTSRSREELTRLLGTSKPADVVVLRARPASPPQSNSNTTLKADNLRLTHRISYLEEQVRELQTKDSLTTNKPGGAHVTSISITSPPASPPDGCQPGEIEVFRRGSQITTVLHGKVNKPNHVTKTLISSNSNGSIKTNGYHIQGSVENMNHVNGSSRSNNITNHRSESRSSHHSNGSRRHSHYSTHNLKSDNETNNSSEQSYYKHGGYNHVGSNNFNGSISADMQYGSNTNISNNRNHYGSITADKQYTNNEIGSSHNLNHVVQPTERINSNGIHNHGHTKNITTRYSENGNHGSRHQNEMKQTYDEFNENRRNRRSVITSRCIESADESRISRDKSRRSRGVLEESNKQWDCRSSKSLELDSIDSCRSIDYTSEPLGSKRPAPPKKPLRLSLHRARSLQAVTNGSISLMEQNGDLTNNQGKRPAKRSHHSSSNRKRGEVV